MLTCRFCGCNCDPSDLINGICDDCRQQEETEEMRKRKMAQFMTAEFSQMEIREFINRETEI